jgi:hypothetical protein
MNALGWGEAKYVVVQSRGQRTKTSDALLAPNDRGTVTLCIVYEVDKLATRQAIVSRTCNNTCERIYSR